MVPGIFARWSKALLELVTPQSGERVLDLACGTGAVARMAAPLVEPGGSVCGVDFNGAQIALARSVDPTIDWQEGDAGSLPFDESEFNLVVCQQGFQFFPDRIKAVKEIWRVLKPGGRVGIAVWSSIEKCPGYLALAHALERTVGSTAAGLMDELFALSNANETKKTFAHGGFPEAALTSPSYDAVFASAEEFTRAIAVGSIMRRTETKFSEGTLDLLSSDVAAEIAPYVREEGLAFPMEAHLLTARK